MIITMMIYMYIIVHVCYFKYIFQLLDKVHACKCTYIWKLIIYYMCLSHNVVLISSRSRYGSLVHVHVHVYIVHVPNLAVAHGT